MDFLSDCWKYIVLAFIIGFISLIYFHKKHTYSYWERKGFKYVPYANYILGHFKSIFTQKESLADFSKRIYNSTKEPFIGIYGGLCPTLFIRDPEIVQSILIKDFNYFTDRTMRYNEKIDPLSAHLGSLPGPMWRNLRSKLSPAFGSSRVKAMFSYLIDSGSSLQNHLDKLADSGEFLDVLEIASCYTTNVIASVAFGVEVDSIADPNTEFRICTRKMFEPSLMNGFRLMLMFLSPKLMDILRIKTVCSSVEKFLVSLVKQNLEYREKNNVIRKDFFQLLIQLRNAGEIKLNDEWNAEIKADENQKTLTINEMAANSFLFIAGGFETAAKTIAFCMYELAKNQDIQAQLHEEIDRILAKHNGEITYESVAEMKYLEACMDETLRRYPVFSFVVRTCVEDYIISGTNKTIEKDVQIFIPSYSLQMDEQYYEEPKKFKPERFFGDGSAKYSVNKPYLGFGDGPRNCIGLKLGKMQTKVAIILMMQKFKYELEPKLLHWDMDFDPKMLFLAPRLDTNLRVLKR